MVLVLLWDLLPLDIDTVMYSILALFVISYVVNSMQTGLSSSRNVMIISKATGEIKKYIANQADRGMTEIPVKGGVLQAKVIRC